MSTNIQKVFKNTIYYVIARAIPALVGIVMLPIYTYYLTAEDYGIIGLVLALEALLPTILGLKLTDGMSRFFFEHEGKELSIFITTILQYKGKRTCQMKGITITILSIRVVATAATSSVFSCLA